MSGRDVARHRAAMPPGADRVLDRRTLARDQRRLAQLLAPGLAVLDVGCGTGVITRGAVEAWLRAWAVSTATAHAMYLLAMEGVRPG
jgi:ubiquinone/menaquinone biosynthesis C-methylase UbiE